MGQFTFSQSDYLWNKPRTKPTKKNYERVARMQQEATAKSRKPTLQEHVAQKAARIASKVAPEKTAQRFGRSLGDAVNWLTPAGNVMDAQTFGRDAQGAAGRGDALGAVGNAGGAMLSMLPIPGALRKPVTAGVKKGIRAYHGSPHDFDKFSMDKLGTGEGAQAYGHGLYFAENEGVARSYRDALAARHDGVAQKYQLPPTAALSASSYLDEAGGDADKAIRAMRSSLDDILGDLSKVSPEEMKRTILPMQQKWKAKEDYIREIAGREKPGKMYEVNINASPDEFLDWDAPLSGQSESLKSIAPEVFNKDQSAYLDLSRAKRDAIIKRQDPTEFELPIRAMEANHGNQFYNYLSDKLRGKIDYSPHFRGGDAAQKEAARLLNEQGIKGIKYKDAGSRDVADGTSNYVVFDDSLIDIMRKYGLLGAAGLGGAAAMTSQPAEAKAGGIFGQSRPRQER